MMPIARFIIQNGPRIDHGLYMHYLDGHRSAAIAALWDVDLGVYKKYLLSDQFGRQYGERSDDLLGHADPRLCKATGFKTPAPCKCFGLAIAPVLYLSIYSDLQLLECSPVMIIETVCLGISS